MTKMIFRHFRCYFNLLFRLEVKKWIVFPHWIKGIPCCPPPPFSVLSMLLVPPSRDYLDYLDFRVLALLFCLMAVVAALRSAGLFAALSSALLGRMNTARALTTALVLLPFFTSMWITNDVALITFVPFAILVLSRAGRADLLCRTIVLQTLAPIWAAC